MPESLRSRVKSALQTLDPGNSSATPEQRFEAWQLIHELVTLMLGEE